MTPEQVRPARDQSHPHNTIYSIARLSNVCRCTIATYVPELGRHTRDTALALDAVLGCTTQDTRPPPTSRSTTIFYSRTVG
jgi:hypothetical protein